MTPRRIREVRERTAQPPAVLTWKGDPPLTAEVAQVIKARWRAITRYPVVVHDERLGVTYK